MQNANIGLVDITLTCHFEVKDAEVFGGAGSVGYTSVALKHAKAADQLVGIINNSVQCEGFLYAQRKSTADLLGVPVECVRAITYDQYEAATGDDETEDDDEDYEMQRRGYDVEALPRIFDGTDRLPYMYDKNGWLAVMDGAKAVDFPSRNTIQKMADQMANWGDGARAIVRVQWKGGRSGHVFMAEQQKGGTVFMDPQTGRYVDIHVYMDQAVKGATKLVRIDNLKPTALLEKCVKKRDK